MCGEHSQTLSPHLLALNASTNVEPVDEFLQDGCKRSHTDTAAHQDGHVVAGPILVSLTVWSIQEQLGPRLSSEHCRVNALSEVEGPRSNNPNVEG